MKYLVQHPDGSQKEYGDRDQFTIAYNNRFFGLYHGLRAARCGLRKGKIVVVVNALWILAVVVAVLSFFSD